MRPPQRLEPDLAAAEHLRHLIVSKDYAAACDFFRSTDYRFECVIAREMETHLTLLHLAIERASPSDWNGSSQNPQAFVEAFLRAGIYVDAQDRRGRSVLDIAAMRNLVPVAEAIIERGLRRYPAAAERDMKTLYERVVGRMKELREAGRVNDANGYRQMACLLHGSRDRGGHGMTLERGKKTRKLNPFYLTDSATPRSR